MAENRAHPRYEVNAYVDFTGTDLLLYHKIHNLSLGGICIQSPTIEELGTRVQIVINFPDTDSIVTMLGDVVRVNHKPPKDMGIQWVNVTEHQKASLEAYLESVQSNR